MYQRLRGTNRQRVESSMGSLDITRHSISIPRRKLGSRVRMNLSSIARTRTRTREGEGEGRGRTRVLSWYARELSVAIKSRFTATLESRNSDRTFQLHADPRAVCFAILFKSARVNYARESGPSMSRHRWDARSPREANISSSRKSDEIS